MHQSSKSTFCKFPGGTVEERQRNYLNFAIIWKVLSSFCLWQCLFYYITSPCVAYNKWYTGNKAIFALTNNPLCFSISNMTWLPIRDQVHRILRNISKRHQITHILGNNATFALSSMLGAVHKWRHHSRGRGGVSQKMTCGHVYFVLGGLRK